MEKLKMTSMDKIGDNVAKIKALFPNAVTEVIKNGEPTLAIDFDVLKQELSDCVIDDKQERYQFTWPDKKKSILLANSSITKTLRPCKEESVDFDNTQNLYIEGDNLDVLKLLQETYLGKIKMIYIDPPYNTGNDFVYEDDFAQTADEYLANSGQFDEQGNRLFQNTEANGKYHTDWLNMIYPRLKVAKDLLLDDGVIFISIDENEIVNLKKICDEIFGAINFVGIAIRKTRGSATTKGEAELQCLNDFVLIYIKNKLGNALNKKIIGEKTYPYQDERGKYYIVPLQDNGPHGTREARPNLWYPIYQLVDGSLSYIQPEYECKTYFPSMHQNKEGRWMWSKEKFDKDNHDLVIHNGKVHIKHYFDPNEDQNKYQFEKLWLEDFQNAKGTIIVNELFDVKGIFNNPKPIELLNWCLKLATGKESIVLDFFSGSSSTAHAVMKLNAEDGGNRKFIMVQLPEDCDINTTACKAGYKNICEIGKERIRRAGAKIKADSPLTTQGLDVGFRVLKLDSSNMQDVYYNPSAMPQSLLDSTVDNIKPDRTPMDLLFQVMLQLGVELSAKIEETSIKGKKVYTVNDNDIIACFDDDIDNDVITEIAKQQPIYAVFRDSSFSTDSVGINNEQLFKTYSPSTEIKVI